MNEKYQLLSEMLDNKIILQEGLFSIDSEFGKVKKHPIANFYQVLGYSFGDDKVILDWDLIDPHKLTENQIKNTHMILRLKNSKKSIYAAAYQPLCKSVDDEERLKSMLSKSQFTNDSFCYALHMTDTLGIGVIYFTHPAIANNITGACIIRKSKIAKIVILPMGYLVTNPEDAITHKVKAIKMPK